MTYDAITGLTFIGYSLPPPAFPAASINRLGAGRSPPKGGQGQGQEHEAGAPRHGLALVHTSHKKTKRTLPRQPKSEVKPRKQVLISLQITAPQVYVDPGRYPESPAMHHIPLVTTLLR